MVSLTPEKVIFKNVSVLADTGDIKTDILCENGIISKINAGIGNTDALVLNCDGLTATPSLCDMHVHMREPGQEYKEDIGTGARAAACGGFAYVAAMPNTIPPCDSPDAVLHITSRSIAAAHANVLPIGSITRALAGKELCDIAALKAAGACAVSDDGHPVADGTLLLRAMKLARDSGITMISHCEDLRLSSGGCMNKGKTSDALGLPGIPAEAESDAVLRDILLCEESGCRLHIAHVSTALSAAHIRNAKLRGVNVTAETCPHYFSLTDSAIAKYGVNAKMNPPLQTQADVEAIKLALADGTIDVISTDHAPHAARDKEGGLLKAANGITGLETSFALGVTNLVRTGVLSLRGLIEKMSATPRMLLSLPDGRISEGFPAQFILFDTETPFIFEASSQLSKSRNTPFDGFTLYGRIHANIIEKRLVLNTPMISR